MKNSKNHSGLAMLAILTVAIFSGCASTGKVAVPSTETVRYKFVQNDNYKYRQSSEMNQVMIYMGQEMGATVSSMLEVNLIPGETADGTTSLGVTIDTLGITVKSIQGDFVNPGKDVIGKHFMMKLSDIGKESDMEEAAKIKYTIAGQETNLLPSFTMFFPDLPAEAIKVGYTWSKTDTVDLSAGTESATMILTSNNTVTGRETVSGLDCYVISSLITGIRDATSNSAQGTISSTGDITGAGTLHFAPKEGIFVRDVTKIKVDGSLLIPTGESIPLIIDTEYKTELIR